MAHETAGDPVRGLKWTRRTTAKIAAQLRTLGIDVCARTVARLLKAMGFSLRVNHKKLAGASHPNRNDQFEHITALHERCAAENTPVISVDTKKKELVGAFKNAGAKWDRSPELVKDHDFRSEAKGRAVPYGIYDPQANTGTVFVGATADTPAFSNGCTPRAWKFNLQHRLCNRHGLRVTVAHYPTAASKWNPIEHRLFCEISKNWAGRPLDSFETILKYLRTTRTAAGLRVRAHRVKKVYKTGVKVADAQMRELHITEDSVLPKWNYTIEPIEPMWRKWEFILALALSRHPCHCRFVFPGCFQGPLPGVCRPAGLRQNGRPSDRTAPAHAPRPATRASSYRGRACRTCRGSRAVAPNAGSRKSRRVGKGRCRRSTALPRDVAAKRSREGPVGMATPALGARPLPGQWKQKHSVFHSQF